MFDMHDGRLGLRRLARGDEQKEFRCNYVIDVYDPVTFEKICTQNTTDGKWRELPSMDSRVKFFKFRDAIYDADWFVDARCCNEHCDGYDTEIGEMYMENELEVFKVMLKVFKEG
jgi:hypothetical protein